MIEKDSTCNLNKTGQNYGILLLQEMTILASFISPQHCKPAMKGGARNPVRHVRAKRRDNLRETRIWKIKTNCQVFLYSIM
jgi:hypothetical protein